MTREESSTHDSFICIGLVDTRITNYYHSGDSHAEQMKNQITNDEKLIAVTPTIFHILVVLSGGDRHGYAILREVEEIAEGRSKLGPTTLYRSIRTMLEGNLIQELDERPDPELDDERRRYYRLTDLGAKLLRHEVSRLENLLKVVRKNSVLIENRSISAWGQES